MKPFGLQIVLNYRKRQEDIAKHRLNEAKMIQKTIEEKLKEEQKALKLFIDETERLQREGIEITELIRYEERISAQKENVAAIAKNLEEKRSLVEDALKNLVKKSREKQILERLKETQDLAWKKYLDKKEAAMLDEIASTRHQSDMG